MDEYQKKLDALFAVVLSENASDLHISEGKPPMIRVTGFLVPLVKYPPITKEDAMGLLSVLITKEEQEKLKVRRDVDFSYTYQEKARFRGNAFYQQEMISIALRHIPKHVRTLAELNLPSILEELAARQQGFFLVVGPVGHGKTTTLAAMIEVINQTRSEHIVTIENPIEYIYEAKKSIIDQREIGTDTADFKSGLNAAFRQDVDVILIGEMRNPETISAAVTAAETGHLVFSTLHTNNAAQTIDRIIDSFPSQQQPQIRAQLAGSMSGIFSQRLIPRISGGMVPTYELLINTAAVANLIREKRTHEIPTMIETGTEHGMIDMNRSLAELVRSGEITIENARAFSPNPSILDKFI
ncbi:type IV pili twitching motility protein PilT [Candidatus Wolfebacteria bacterium]|nr:MAG: type IV pili twitching motility protein PilT [Candidatus Wolfebacteria bacterium]